MAGGVQFLRLLGRKSDLFSGTLGRHNRREQIPPHARKRPGLAHAVELWQDRGRGLRILGMSERAPKRRGKPPDPGVEILIAGPPPYNSASEWTQERVLAYGRDAVAWVRERLGDDPETAAGVLVEAHAHQDETSPHFHFTIIAATEARPRPSKGAVEMALARAPEPFSEYRHLDHRRLIREIQNQFQEDVAGGHGLTRGEIGSRSRHAPPDHEKGLLEELEREQLHSAASADRADDEAEKRAAAEDREMEAHARADSETRRAAEQVRLAGESRAEAARQAALRKKAEARADAAEARAADAAGRAEAAEEARFKLELVVEKAAVERDLAKSGEGAAREAEARAAIDGQGKHYAELRAACDIGRKALTRAARQEKRADRAEAEVAKLRGQAASRQVADRHAARRAEKLERSRASARPRRAPQPARGADAPAVRQRPPAAPARAPAPQPRRFTPEGGRRAGVGGADYTLRGGLRGQFSAVPPPGGPVRRPAAPRPPGWRKGR